MTLEANIRGVATIKTQVTDLNTNVTALQRSIEALTLAIEQRQQQPMHEELEDEADGSVAGAAPLGRGRPNDPAPTPLHGRGFAPIGRAQRVPI